ncbi:MAG: hypothetical protein A2341_05350 [Deltaproteobacteria bacterium RIFOXYB12_FULL_58_9]|nr:MAG: hypothetical protein A2341_05350 [Deltaproteobacteria bacterium RIFOXYB12_FULL_58_9]
MFHDGCAGIGGSEINAKCERHVCDYMADLGAIRVIDRPVDPCGRVTMERPTLVELLIDPKLV